MARRFVGTNELKEDSASVLRDISATGAPCFITEGGKAKAVILDIARYNALLDLIEESELPREFHRDSDFSVQQIIKRSSQRIKIS